MKTRIKMRVTPEQQKEVTRIAESYGIKLLISDIIVGDFAVLYPKNDVGSIAIMDSKRLSFLSHPYEEVDADLFIRTNGTCEEWKPEMGEMIMVWENSESYVAKREFITMTKDGDGFICHNESGRGATSWPNAKPVPKEWYETVSEEKPVFCWVSDEDQNEMAFAAFVVGYNEDAELKFETPRAIYYKFATPVTCDDLSCNQ